MVSRIDRSRSNTAVAIYSFAASGTNGRTPYAGLTLGPNGNFYGTTYYGGVNNDGTVFKVTTNGSLTTLVNFNGTNGANPVAGLTLGPDGSFYGTTKNGGNTSQGTVFKLTSNGDLTTLVNFAATNGAGPSAGLTWGPDGNLYGTTEFGGLNGDGTGFQMTTNGTLGTLVDFNITNGANPVAGLTLGADGNLYGTTDTTITGSSTSYEAVFQMTTNGTLTTLVNFNGTNNGVSPETSLTLGTDGNFYGATTHSGITPINAGPGSPSTCPRVMAPFSE